MVSPMSSALAREGHQPIELTPTRLLRLSKDLPHDWKEQRLFLGFAA
jgi:site-specific DNA recombinase